MALAGGFKPLLPTKIPMDSSKAMSTLGFSSSQGFENTEMEDIQKAFLHKIQRLENMPPGRRTTNKRDEIRKINEAYQYLVRKRRKLTGRAMTENWQLVGGKSNTAMDIISSLKGPGAFALSTNSLQKKQAEMDMKKIIEKESETAKAFADEIVSSAGLERSVTDILNVTTGKPHSNNNGNSNQGHSKSEKKIKKKSQEARSSIFAEELSRRSASSNSLIFNEHKTGFLASTMSATSTPTHLLSHEISKPKRNSKHSKSFTSASTKRSDTLQLDRKPEVIVSTNDLIAIGKSLDNSSEDRDILNVSNLTITQASSVPNLTDVSQD